MGFTNSDGLSLADVAAVAGNGNGLFGDGDGGSFALLILFLFAIMGGNWGGNGFGGNGGAFPYVVSSTVDNDVQRGFDQSAVMGSLSGITSAVSNGFANAEISRANNMTNLLQSINSLSMAQQNCCCENRAAVADLKYTVATEACADRAAVTDGVRDIQDSISTGIQTILTQMCNDKIDAKNERIAELQTQLNMANLKESQNSQTAAILANNAAQTAALEQYLNPAPIPAYVVQNPNCCGQATFGCGCGA